MQCYRKLLFEITVTLWRPTSNEIVTNIVLVVLFNYRLTRMHSRSTDARELSSPWRHRVKYAMYADRVRYSSFIVFSSFFILIQSHTCACQILCAKHIMVWLVWVFQWSGVCKNYFLLYVSTSLILYLIIIINRQFLTHCNTYYWGRKVSMYHEIQWSSHDACQVNFS